MYVEMGTNYSIDLDIRCLAVAFVYADEYYDLRVCAYCWIKCDYHDRGRKALFYSDAETMIMISFTSRIWSNRPRIM